MMARAHPSFALRPLLPADVPLLADIFRASVEALTGEDYSERQQEAWASAAGDEEAFGAKLGKGLTLVATLEGSPVGFISLAGTDRIRDELAAMGVVIKDSKDGTTWEIAR